MVKSELEAGGGGRLYQSGGSREDGISERAR